MYKAIKNFVIYYLPVLIWVVVIFYFSSLPDLKVGTGSVLWEIIIRKAAHIGEYVILFWLLWRLAHDAWNLIPRDAIIISFILTVLYAGSDEWHQTFVPGRSGRLIDVIFDALSAFLAVQIVIWFSLKKWRKYALSLVVATLLVISGMEYKMIKDGEKIVMEENQKISDLEKINSEAEKTIETQGSQDQDNQQEAASLPKNIPAKMKIDVPFTSQAPLGVWDAYHEEACEESAVIMAKYYLDHKSLNPDLAEKEIQGLIKFEIDKYGDYKDSNADQIVKMAHDYYGINNMKVVRNFTREDIKKYLAEGKPIIVPAAGRLLGNPYYTAPGPLYHALVLTGYDGDTIVTNDSGTKRGQGYVYNINVLYNAIHDFPGKPEDIEKGPKAMIVLE